MMTDFGKNRCDMIFNSTNCGNSSYEYSNFSWKAKYSNTLPDRGEKVIKYMKEHGASAVMIKRAESDLESGLNPIMILVEDILTSDSRTFSVEDIFDLCCKTAGPIAAAQFVQLLRENGKPVPSGEKVRE